MHDLCCIGDLVWLITLSIDDFPSSGGVSFVHNIERSIGNDASIASIMASRLGIKTELRSNPVSGNDAEPLLKLLKTYNVDYSSIPLTLSHTPATHCIKEARGNRTWLPELSEFSVKDVLSRPLVSKLIYLDLYEEFLQERISILSEVLMSSSRVLINLSASSLDLKISLLETIPQLDLVQVSLNSSMEDGINYGRMIIARVNANAVIVTLGEIGSTVVTKDNAYVRHNTNHTIPLRTVGAGATYSAAFLKAIKNGSDYQKANEYAGIEATDFCFNQRNPLQIM